MVRISALPLFRAKRGGEEDGRKLDPFELSSSHYGCMKSRVGCRVGVEIRRYENSKQLLQVDVAPSNNIV